jgi:uncharacterized membrane protein
MAKDLGDTIGSALGQAAREAVQTVSANNRRRGSNPLSGPAGLAAGAGLVALAPLATKGAGKLVRGLSSNGASPVKKAGDKLGGTVKDAVGETVEKAGGAGGIAKEAGKSLLPGGGGGGGGRSKGKPGVGKGRRMPIQQDIDIGVPIKQVYNQWTQFEDWPEFMHRLDNVSQEDESHVSFKTKIWGISKEFKAEIVEQHPDERIKWEVTEGVTHTGVVTFHELGPRLTRVELNIDVQPGSLIEKAARGMRHVKRAVRADLARFKAHALMEGEASGAWRGQIEDGNVKRRSSSSGNRSKSSGSRSKASSSGRARASSSGRSTKASSSGRSTKASSGRGTKASSSRRSSSSRSRASSSSNGGGSGSRSSGRRKTSGSRS